MDQIFDRLERLIKSWVTPDSDESPTRQRGGGGYGDPDLDAAMDELDDFLDRDRGAAEARERARREHETRARASAEANRNSSAAPDRRLVEAYRTLGLAYGAPFAQVKVAYKKLLKEHHPDRHNASPADQKQATEISAKINAAYQLLEVWTSTGKIPEN